MSNLPHKIHTALRVLKNNGFLAFWMLFVSKLVERYDLTIYYKKWMKETEKNQLEVRRLSYEPKISVVVPIYNVEADILQECIRSVIKQSYKNWELCLVDDCSTYKEVRDVLKNYEGLEQIKIKYRTENGNISKATNDGITLATGVFVAFLDCDDVLSPNALYEVAKKLNENKEYDFIYSDEDKLSIKGKRHLPFFKPDWSPDTLMALMYTCHLSVYRKSLLESIGGLRSQFDGSQDYDLVLRVTEKTNKIAHIPKVLYHWRETKQSTALTMDAKPYALQVMKKVKEEALLRRGIKGEVVYDEEEHQYHVIYQISKQSLVSIVIPSKDNYLLLKQCIDSIQQVTTYQKVELILVDNGSGPENQKKYRKLCEANNITYVYEKEEFNFSKMCNKGAVHAKGEYLLFLNDDIEVTQKDWLERMLGQAQLPHVGAVGAKLLYPNSNIIQHAGVVNLAVGPSHCLTQKRDNRGYYFGRNKCNYNYIAVTGACLLVEKKKFFEVGGFDESFPIAYNDVELCFRFLERGLYNVIRNDVILYHHESVSRGDDRKQKETLERLNKEREALYQKHEKYRNYDPFYNVNLSGNSSGYEINYKGRA